MSEELDFSADVLRQWLDAELGASAALEVEPMRGGGSCDLFKIERAGHSWVMRRAPRNASSSTAHNVTREYKILKALSGENTSGKPIRVPHVLAACEDKNVAGADFYIMEYIDGEVIRRKLPSSYLQAPEQQPHIGENLIDALVELHDFDWRNSSMVALAKPERFLERQVERWLHQLSSYRCRDIEGIDEVADWLSCHRPPTGELTVMHGDYKTDNAIFSKDLPPRILKLVDFEMTTVGDPLIDLAWAMIFWPEPGKVISIAGFDGPDGMNQAYCQQPQDLVQRYADATGRDMSHFQWYQAFAAWKLAIVLEGSYAKHLRGESTNPQHPFYGFVIDQLMLRARQFAV